MRFSCVSGDIVGAVNLQTHPKHDILSTNKRPDAACALAKPTMKTEVFLMKKWLAALLLALLLPACALGDSEGVIVQSSCNIVQSGNYYLAYCFAQVHNNASTVICLDRGTFDLQSGETLLSTSEVAQIWPYFLNPGEDGYLFDIVSFEPDENGNPVVPSITGISYNLTYLPVDAAFANYDLSAVSEIVQDASGDMSVICRLTNPTEMDAYNPTVAIGLYTDSGAMLYSDGTTLQDVGIPAGGTVLVRFDVDEAFVAQWQSYGAMPTQVHTNASFRHDED